MYINTGRPYIEEHLTLYKIVRLYQDFGHSVVILEFFLKTKRGILLKNTIFSILIRNTSSKVVCPCLFCKINIKAYTNSTFGSGLIPAW